MKIHNVKNKVYGMIALMLAVISYHITGHEIAMSAIMSVLGVYLICSKTNLID